MKCWACGGEVIWGGDHDDESDEGSHLIVSNLTCMDCDAFYLMYHGQREDADDRQDQTNDS